MIKNYVELPARNTPSHIVLLLHGYAMRGEHMLRLFANQIATHLPNLHFYAPDGIHQVPNINNKFDWLGYHKHSTSEQIHNAINNSHMILEQFIHQKLTEHKLDESKLFIVGFSQGTRIALHTGLRSKNSYAGIIGYSGALSFPESITSEIISKPTIELIHGDIDEVVPAAFSIQAWEILKKLDLNINLNIVPGLGHKISPKAAEIGMQFIRDKILQ